MLHAFSGNPDGANPYAPLLRDASGSFYGTTNGGGQGSGTVFEISASGEETVLYRFLNTPDGANPQGGLVEDAEGNLYGTTLWGGAYNGGTVFKLTKTGTETIVHSFRGSSQGTRGDGTNPQASLIIDSAGNLYGTSLAGGTGACHGGCGTIFMITAAGVETVLHSFPGGTSGADYPHGALARDSAGNLYTTTEYGGSCTRTSMGCGTVFKLNYNNGKWWPLILHKFIGLSDDGAFPASALTLDSAGILWGTTENGGAHDAGTVFKMSPSGKELLVFSFNVTAGYQPVSALVQDSSGNFYGTTSAGGGNTGCAGQGCGTIYEITPTGVESVLFVFPSNGYEGANPLGGVTLDPAGNLYGTSSYDDGYPTYGNVFELTR
jgi:uncharacterized repeat protein (TIGR03803 family)